MNHARYVELRAIVHEGFRAGMIRSGLADAIVGILWDIRKETPESVDGCSCLNCQKARALEARKPVIMDAAGVPNCESDS